MRDIDTEMELNDGIDRISENIFILKKENTHLHSAFAISKKALITLKERWDRVDGQNTTSYHIVSSALTEIESLEKKEK